MTYSQKLKDPRWQKKRLEIMERDRFTCRACDDNETSLQVHHIIYTKSELHEEPTVNLVTLCEECHKIIESYKLSNKKVLSLRKLKYDGGGVLFISKCDDGNIYFDTLDNGALRSLFGMTHFRFFAVSEYLK